MLVIQHQTFILVGKGRSSHHFRVDLFLPERVACDQGRRAGGRSGRCRVGGGRVGRVRVRVHHVLEKDLISALPLGAEDVRIVPESEGFFRQNTPFTDLLYHLSKAVEESDKQRLYFILFFSFTKSYLSSPGL